MLVEKHSHLRYLDKFDLLDKLIEEHINEMQKICESASETDDLAEGNIGLNTLNILFILFSTVG